MSNGRGLGQRHSCLPESKLSHTKKHRKNKPLCFHCISHPTGQGTKIQNKNKNKTYLPITVSGQHAHKFQSQGDSVISIPAQACRDRKMGDIPKSRLGHLLPLSTMHWSCPVVRQSRGNNSLLVDLKETKYCTRQKNVLHAPEYKGHLIICLSVPGRWFT